MVLAPTGAAGGRTWYVARALQREARVHGRVAGHQLAVVWSSLGRFLTRVVGALTRHMAHIVRGVRGTRLHALTSDGALRDRTRAWTHGQGACFATNGGALCRGRGTIQRAWLEKYGGTR